MKILDWMSGTWKKLFETLTSVFGSGPKRGGGGSSDGPPENGSRVPKRPRPPQRGAAAAQKMPDPIQEPCDLVGGRR